MDCCQFEQIDNHFDRRKAQRQLEEYRVKGRHTTTSVLVNALIAQGVDGATLLDIGGGIGAIQHALLTSGVRHATNLEVSAAYIDACRREAQKQGYADRITHVQGDFTRVNDVPPADIVTLERVICCYPDMVGLITQSCAKTRRFLGLVYPHEAWWVKLGVTFLYNLRFKIIGDPFRVHVHSTRAVEKIVTDSGLHRLFFQRVGQWQVFVYGRAP